MVVVALLQMLFAILKFLMTPINLPDLAAIDDVHQLMSYITGMAYNLVYFILPQGTVSTLFTILLAVIAARYLYSFIMWVIRKIPGGMN